MTVALAVLLSVSAGAQERLAELRRPFAYDASRPLEAKLGLLFEGVGHRAYDLSYSSPKGGRVTGYLVTPRGRGRHAGIVFGHWGQGNRTEFLPEAALYAEAGAVSVLIDYPWVRPAPWRRPQGRGLDEPEKDRDSWVGAVVDLQRALDLLESRDDVDARRIGYVGHSYGAQWGAVLAAIDDRVQAAVLMAGVPDFETILRSDEPGIAALREGSSRELIERYLELNRPYDGVRYVPHATPTPLLFQFARYETYLSEADMQRYFDAASRPKEILWYHTGHELNEPRALSDRAAWLTAKLGLLATRPLLEKRLAGR